MPPAWRSGWKALAAGLLLAAATGPAGALDPGPIEEGALRRRALLVGVQAYPDDAGWPQLRGPRTDVAALRDALLERAGFAPEDVHVLLDEDAPRKAILARFRELAEASGEGDVLLFYFSGHGSQLADADGDESDGWDETLIPFDARTPDGVPNDLLDDELRELISVANRKTEHVVFILDCCNSGTNVRGNDEVVPRFVPPTQRGLGGERGLAGVRVSGTKGRKEEGSGFLEGGLRYVSLSACRAKESALEVQFEDGERSHGLFTYSLLQELYALRGDISYRKLVERVRQRVWRVRRSQTPVVEGPLGDRSAFRGGATVTPPSYRITGDPPRLAAGRVNGISPGARLDVWRDDDSLGDPGARIGSIVVTEVLATKAPFQWEGGQPAAVADAGDGNLRAVLVEPGRDELRLPFALHAGAEHAAAADAMRERLEGTGTLRATSAGQAHLNLSLEGDGDGLRWRVHTAEEVRLPLEAALDDGAALERLELALGRLGTRHVLEGGVLNEQSNELSIDVQLERIDASGRPVTEEEDGGGPPRLRPGDTLRFRLRNESEVPVYASLLVLSPDGEVYLAHGARSEDDRIEPGREIVTQRMKMVLNQGSEAFYAHGMECFRWIVTTRLHDLSNLEQEPATRVAAMRGVARQTKLPEEPDTWVTHTVHVRLAP